LQGVFYQSEIDGHFLAEAAFAKDDNIGLILVHEKNGKPDVKNYTMLCVDQNDAGRVVLSVKDCQNGVKNVLDNTGLTSFEEVDIDRDIEDDDSESEDEEDTKINLGTDLYQHVLTGTQYSVPFSETDKKIRIFKESNGGFFHFYYAVKNVIQGKEVADWMELRPSKDWARPGTNYYVGLVALDKGEATFNSLTVKRKSVKDKDDRHTGFAVNEREYNWSGFYGDAVVVSFDSAFPYADSDVKFVFWTEMNYIPAWHIDNQLLYTYEFVETWGGGEPGCHEPMSDRLRRWTSVEVLEDNPVRKVVHWHYVLCNPDYRYPDNDEGEQAPEVDEYFTFYPDGSGTRHIRYTPKLDTDFREAHELGELISIAGSKTNSGVLHARPALTILNLEGDVKEAHPGPKFDYYSPIDDWKQQIQAVHLTNGPDVFCAWSVDPRIPQTYSGYKIRYENAWQNPDINPVHWPVNKRPYTRAFSSPGTWDAEVSHACLLSFGVRDGTDWTDQYQTDERGRKYREWISLIGLNEPNDFKTLKLKTRSWLFPGKISTDNNLEFLSVDYKKKSLVFNQKSEAETYTFKYHNSDESDVLINPIIEIKSWIGSPIEAVYVNDKILPRSTYRSFNNSEGRLLLWLNKVIKAEDEIRIEKS
jgi:hypothetical protein